MPRGVISDLAYKLEVDEIQPCADHILIEVLERNRSAAGLILPQKEKTECLYGRVIRTGLGEMNPVTGEVYPMGVKPGDVIMSVQYMGEKIQAVGKKYKLLREHGIWATLKLKVKSELDWEIEELTPYRDHLTLKMDSEEKSLKGRIFLPDNPQVMYRLADVVQVGPGVRNLKSGIVSPIDMKKGDRVICLRYAGCIVRVKGLEYRLASEQDIEAIVEGDGVDVLAGQDSLPKPSDDYNVIPEAELDGLNTKLLRDAGAIKSNSEAPNYRGK